MSLSCNNNISRVSSLPSYLCLYIMSLVHRDINVVYWCVYSQILWKWLFLWEWICLLFYLALSFNNSKACLTRMEMSYRGIWLLSTEYCCHCLDNWHPCLPLPYEVKSITPHYTNALPYVPLSGQLTLNNSTMLLYHICEILKLWI